MTQFLCIRVYFLRIRIRVYFLRIRIHPFYQCGSAVIDPLSAPTIEFLIHFKLNLFFSLNQITLIINFYAFFNFSS